MKTRRVASYVGALAPAAVIAVLLAVYELLFGRFFPTRIGTLGHDYEYFLPHLVAGQFFYLQNGWLRIPWFTPFACGGVPAFPNPQDLWFSVPQWLTFALDPLTSVHFTLLLFAAAGMVGTYLLLTRRFGVSMPAALLGATVFGYNGFFAYRMVVGHLTAHAFMLLPAISALLVGPLGRTRGEITRSLFAGLLLAYLILTASQFLPPFAFALAALCLLQVVARGDARPAVMRSAAAAAIALALSDARITAVLHFLVLFPRADYPLPGIPSLMGVVATALRLLFVGPRAIVGTRMANASFALGQHELEYGLTIVPAVLLLLCAVILARRFRPGDATPGRRAQWRAGALTGLIALLVVPLALNYYQPTWNAALKSVPLVGSSSTLLRWFCVYIPIVAVGCALGVQRAFAVERDRWIVFALSAIAIPLLIAGTDSSFYDQQPYDPRVLVAADRDVLRSGRVPAVDHVVAYDPDAMVHCASSAMCYEPIFGYRLEHLPRSSLHPGPVMNAGDTLNIRNPACYVFPVANHCAPGAHFLATQRGAAMAFVQYRPFAFEQPPSQRVAGWISALALAVCAVSLAGVSASAVRGRLRLKVPPRAS
jgi:hypothetical protein